MTERLRKILRGGKLTPVTADEQAVKIAVDNAGGGDTYGTVGEIAVGTMEQSNDGVYTFKATNVTVPTIDTSTTYYLNNLENPSSHVDFIEGSPALLFNVDNPEDFLPKDPSKLLVALAYDVQESTCLVMSDRPDLSNTTVKILKKVSGGGRITADDELSETSENPVQNKVITAALEAAKPLIVHGTVDIVNSTAEITDEISLGEIYDAAEAGRFVAFECSLGEGNATRMELTSRTLVGGEYSFVFNAAADMNNKPAVVIVTFENSKTGTFERAVAQ